MLVMRLLEQKITSVKQSITHKLHVRITNAESEHAYDVTYLCGICLEKLSTGLTISVELFEARLLLAELFPFEE